jgi:hypothetical protein
MEQIIIQYGVKQGDIAEFVRSHGDDILIGRSFKNALVIQDDYIAPEQLRIFQKDDCSWWMEVLDQTNSVLLNKEAQNSEASAVQIHSGDSITIGRTTLSIYSADHKVEKTRKLLTRSLHQDSIGLTIPLILLFLFSAFDIAKEHFLTLPQESFTSYITTILISMAIILVWVSLWGLAGRIFRHNSHFGQQLLATTLISLLISVLSPWPYWFEFNFSSITTGLILNYLLAFVSIALLLKFHLLFATNIRRTGRVALAISTLIVGGTASYQTYLESEFSANAEYSLAIQPNFMHLGSDTSMDQYLDQMQEVFNKIDEQQLQDKKSD